MRTVLDPVAGIIVGLFIIKVSIDLLRNGIGDLMEQSLPDEVENEILQLAGSIPGVTEPHALRTRRLGNHYAIELHILMDDDIRRHQFARGSQQERGGRKDSTRALWRRHTHSGTRRT